MNLFFMLLAAHCIADYPLQGDFLAKAKNPFSPVPGVPWWQALYAHSLIHGGFVALITGNVWLGIAETLVHSSIDYQKCAKRFGFNADQFFHVLCKVAWAIAAYRMAKP